MSKQDQRLESGETPRGTWHGRQFLTAAGFRDDRDGRPGRPRPAWPGESDRCWVGGPGHDICAQAQYAGPARGGGPIAGYNRGAEGSVFGRLRLPVQLSAGSGLGAGRSLASRLAAFDRIARTAPATGSPSRRGSTTRAQRRPAGTFLGLSGPPEGATLTPKPAAAARGPFTGRAGPAHACSAGVSSHVETLYAQLGGGRCWQVAGDPPAAHPWSRPPLSGGRSRRVGREPRRESMLAEVGRASSIPRWTIDQGRTAGDRHLCLGAGAREKNSPPGLCVGHRPAEPRRCEGEEEGWIVGLGGWISVITSCPRRARGDRAFGGGRDDVMLLDRLLRVDSIKPEGSHEDRSGLPDGDRAGSGGDPRLCPGRRGDGVHAHARLRQRGRRQPRSAGRLGQPVRLPARLPRALRPLRVLCRGHAAHRAGHRRPHPPPAPDGPRRQAGGRGGCPLGWSAAPGRRSRLEPGRVRGPRREHSRSRQADRGTARGHALSGRGW